MLVYREGNQALLNGVKNMLARIINKEFTGDITKNRKEKNFYFQYTVVSMKENGVLHTPVELRLYATKSKHYACIWVRNGSECQVSGGGSASGYGYHKASAAVDAAIQNAGIFLEGSLAGVGDTAIREAITAIAKSMGFEKVYVLEAHA